ncbi:hypothetical protein ACK3SF_02470 [Candidatus Nanosalina sp. VS9-1]|uniref:hypothetical protein n=1 Tax=Candidatus Nanosalina sp. VS9-1 TaxID=3388566 RepID=UPI0039DF3E0F
MPAMDPKILAAVFASIAALTVSGSGSVEDFQNFSPGDFLDGSLGDIPLDIDNIVGELTDRPEPTNSVEVTVNLNSDETTLTADNAILEIEAFERLESKSRVIESDGRLSFSNFTGDVVLRKDNTTGLRGQSTGFSSSGVTLVEKMDVNYNTNASRIILDELKRSKISLENANIDMSSESGTEISQENSPLKINSFNGKITILPGENQVRMEGLVDRLEAGGATFTG